MSYADEKQRRCKHCAKATAIELDGRRHRIPPTITRDARYFICTAPSAEEYIAELEANLRYVLAEKHGAQADAEREKNRADTLTSSLAEARKDTARLDWLLERPQRMPIGSEDRYIVQEWHGRTTGRGSTPRAAIDAAMECK